DGSGTGPIPCCLFPPDDPIPPNPRIVLYRNPGLPRPGFLFGIATNRSSRRNRSRLMSGAVLPARYRGVTCSYPGAAGISGSLGTARQPTCRLWARDAVIEKKDLLKARGYSWSAGEFGRPRCWYRDVPPRPSPGRPRRVADTGGKT